MYVLFPEQSVYMEMENQQVTLDESETLETKLADVADVKKLGKEKVQGFTCIKYLVTYHDPNAGKSTIWVSEKLNYPLKIYSESPQDTVTITYYDVVIGKVDPSLFEIPDGYEKMDMKMLY
jgi:outer membrane lipoprotein-sorting protein